jgi:photosystem II stability/assembly factor-like uncharacterized protein
LLSQPVAADSGAKPPLPSRPDGKATHEEPGAAHAYYMQKRQSLTGDVDMAEAYLRAQAHMQKMPRYSAATGRMLQLPQDRSRRAGEKGALQTWEPLGPGNIGGRTRSLLIHPDDPSIIYTGGVSGGIWKTTDGGGSWQPLSDTISNIAIGCMAMHPENPDVIYAGTGEGYFREEVRETSLPLRGAGVFRTGDGGVTWSRLDSTANQDFHWVNDIIFSQRNPLIIYAATRSGVWLSGDAGETWEQILATTVKGGCLDLALRTDLSRDWLFASCGTFEQATIYRTKLPGGEWQAVHSDPGMGRTYLAIAPSDQRIVYALSASNNPGHYNQGLHAVFRSTSGGNAGTWRTRISNTDPESLSTMLLSNALGRYYEEECGGDTSFHYNLGWYTNVIAVDPLNPETVWAGGIDLYRSDDGGRSWGVAGYYWAFGYRTYIHADQHAIAFHPGFNGNTNQTVLVANDGGVFRSTNARAAVSPSHPSAICDPLAAATSWTALNHNLGITQFYHGAPFARGTSFLGGTQDNGTIMGTDALGNDSWWSILGSDGGYVAVDPTNSQIIYAEAQRFDFHKSTDRGQSFVSARQGVNDTFLFITPFVMDPNNPRRLWTGGRRLWRTDNAAAFWQVASTYLSDTNLVSALAVAPGDSNRVIVGLDGGRIVRNNQALTADAGSSWQSAQPRPGYVSWLAHDPSDLDIVYATYAGFGGSHVWQSSDGGATWSELDGSGAGALPDIPVHCIVVDPEHPNRLFLGTDLGVFTSVDRGQTWAVEVTGFANTVTESLAITENAQGNQLLFAFTHGRGAWRVELVPDQPAARRVRRRQ